MANALNPFVRSQMKFVEPLRLVTVNYDGWGSVWNLEYRASRGAADAGLLGRQFSAGKLLVVEGKNLVVDSADMTLTNSTVDEVTIRVRAVDFQAVLARATGTANKTTVTGEKAAAVPKTTSLAPVGRRLLR
jgi:hypothetical protein